MGLEGILSKRLDSRSGRTGRWRKIKCWGADSFFRDAPMWTAENRLRSNCDKLRSRAI